MNNKLKYTTLIFFLLQINFLHAQEFKYKPIFNSEIDDSVKHEIIITALQKVAKSEFSFNFNTNDLKNKELKSEKQEKSSEIKTPQQITDSLKKELGNNFTDAKKNYEIGYQYLRMQNNEEAEKYLQKAYANCEEAFKTVPDTVHYYYTAAAILGLYNNYQAINLVYEKGMENVPDEVGFYLMSIITNLNTGNIEKSTKLCETGMEKFPENEANYFYYVLSKFFQYSNNSDTTLIDKKLRDENYKEHFGINRIEESVKKFPDNKTLETIWYIARQYIMIPRIFSGTNTADDLISSPVSKEDKKEIKQISKYYQKLLKNNDTANKYSILYCLGTLEVLNKNFDKSIEYYNEALADNEKYIDKGENFRANIYLNTASAYLLKKDTANTIKTYIEKINDVPKISDNNFLLKIYIEQGKYNEAEKILENLISTGQFDINTMYALFLWNLSKNKYPEAGNVLAEIEKYVQNDAATIMMKGILETFNNKPNEALEYFKKSNSIEPNKELNDIANIIFQK